MTLDPMQQLVANRRADLLADARQHDLARSAHRGPARLARLRTRTAGLLFAAAARLEMDAARTPRHSSGL
jgi:hypothetical protein